MKLGQKKESEASRDAEREAGLALDIARRVSAAEGERWSADRVMRDFNNAKTSGEKMIALGQLRDGRYDRRAAIDALTRALKDKEVGVRVLAAELLFQWESSDGKDALLKIVADAQATPAAELIHVVGAAEILSNNKVAIPYDSLIVLYRETRDAGVLRVMATERDERYLPILLERARTNPSGMVRLIGDLGAAGGYDVAKQVFERSRNPEVRVNAAWAMYRCGADEAALAFLVAQAQAGLDGKAGADFSAADLAIQHLALTPSASSRQVLEAAVQSKNGITSSTALASLYFVQKDIAFADRFIAGYLENVAVQAAQTGASGTVPKPLPSVSYDLVWRIVRDRNDNRLTSLAVAANQGRSESILGSAGGFPARNAWLRGYLRIPPGDH